MMFLTKDAPVHAIELQTNGAPSFALCVAGVVKSAMLFPVQPNYDLAHRLLGWITDEILRLPHVRWLNKSSA